MKYRTEHDLLGELEIPADALYGIHTQRAVENFPIAGRGVNPALIHAFGAVKLACARTNHDLGYWTETDPRGPSRHSDLGAPNCFAAIEQACNEMLDGLLDEHIVVDALQGGAGTSTNMNVNEVLANRALQILGRPPGEYQTISPTDDINLHQSTNDTYPTSLKVAAVRLLRELERETIGLLDAFQAKEKQFANILKIGRTQYQDAVPTTLGREFGAYADAIARDRWRVYKCEERLRVVNLGGTAIGTGLNAPRQFIFRATENLRAITGLGLARAENLVEATQNTDAFVEVHGILKALASNLLKISADLRVLSSGPSGGFGEIRLPARQAGSSIMPGKVNPVIPEAVGQVGMLVFANDIALAMACSMGNLELNAFMPVIADCLLGSLDMLTAACRVFRAYCIEGIEADEQRCRRHAHGGTAMITALVDEIGYERASDLAVRLSRTGGSLRELVLAEGLMSAERFDEITSPQYVTKLGSRPKKPAAP